MEDPMADPDDAARAAVASLLRIRQTTEFTDEPVDPARVDAITDVARWSGSANNRQPWRFVVIHDLDTIGRIADRGQPHTKTLVTAQAAIAVVLPDDAEREVVDAYDDGRVAERVLIAASMAGLAAAISWIRPDVQDDMREILGLPDELMVRTVMGIGHPSERSKRPRSAPGKGRLPRGETVHRERWPSNQG
jgi:nitroreductase